MRFKLDDNTIRIEAITDPVDGQLWWYWCNEDLAFWEIKWHGPFVNKQAAEADVTRY